MKIAVRIELIGLLYVLFEEIHWKVWLLERNGNFVTLAPFSTIMILLFPLFSLITLIVLICKRKEYERVKLYGLICAAALLVSTHFLGIMLICE